MQQASWIALIELVPAKLRDNLLITTSNGREIAIQGIVRVEDDYIAVRGRLMGSSDIGGGFYFVPWDMIVYLGFTRPVSEPEVLAMYGLKPEVKKVGEVQGQPAGEETPPAPEQRPLPLPTAPAAVEPPPPQRRPAGATPGGGAVPRPPAQPVAPAGTSGQPAPARVSTAALLERLRQRRQGGGGDDTP